MVTTKRQINKERDRFGGYDDGMQSVRADGVVAERQNVVPGDISSVHTVGMNNVTVSDALPELEQLPPITAGSVYADTQTAERPLYSTRETMTVPPRPAPQPKKLEHADIMPSVKTQKALEQASSVADDTESAPSAAQRRRTHTNLNPRTKVLLFVYLAVAFVLAVAVIATGISISRATAQAAELAADIAAKQATVVIQEETIATLTDEATIRDEAVANGMVSAGDPSYTVSRVDKVVYPEAEPHVNGFDKFCDWLSKIIG